MSKQQSLMRAENLKNFVRDRDICAALLGPMNNHLDAMSAGARFLFAA